MTVPIHGCLAMLHAVWVRASPGDASPHPPSRRTTRAGHCRSLADSRNIIKSARTLRYSRGSAAYLSETGLRGSASTQERSVVKSDGAPRHAMMIRGVAVTPSVSSPANAFFPIHSTRYIPIHSTDIFRKTVLHLGKQDFGQRALLGSSKIEDLVMQQQVELRLTWHANGRARQRGLRNKGDLQRPCLLRRPRVRGGRWLRPLLPQQGGERRDGRSRCLTAARRPAWSASDGHRSRVLS